MIAEDRTWFYLLRSSAITIAGTQAIAEVCFHMIAELSAICDPRSSAIIWKPTLTETVKRHAIKLFYIIITLSGIVTHFAG